MRVLDSSESVNLCEYQEQVILVVNVASRCGYTYQYSSLQDLYENYKDQGFVNSWFFQGERIGSILAHVSQTRQSSKFCKDACVRLSSAL